MADNYVLNFSAQEIEKILTNLNNQPNLDNNVLFVEQALSAAQQETARNNMGLNIVEKTDDMTTPVGIDSEGRLWAYPISIKNNITFSEIAEIIRLGYGDLYFKPGYSQFEVTKVFRITIYKAEGGVITDHNLDIDKFLSKIPNIQNNIPYIFEKDPTTNYWSYNGERIIPEEYGFDDKIINSSGVQIVPFCRDLILDIVDLDYDTPYDEHKNHSMTLSSHYTLSDSIGFSAPQAIIYNDVEIEGGKTCIFKYNGSILPQGYYSFETLNVNNNDSPVDLPAGSVLKPYYDEVTKVFTQIVAFKDSKTYNNLGAFTIKYTESIPEKYDINYGEMGDYSSNSERLNPYKIHHAGNPFFDESILKQYLNSNEQGDYTAVGQPKWWSPASKFDSHYEQPSGSLINGFLWGLEPDLKNNIIDVVKRQQYSSKEDDFYSIQIKDIVLKTFIPSTVELNITGDGSKYPTSYGTDKTLTNYLTRPYALYNGETNLKKYEIDNHSNLQAYRLRSLNYLIPYTNILNTCINQDGTINNEGASYTKYAYLPMFCIG